MLKGKLTPLAREWIDLLKVTDKGQCIENLRCGDEYCCLGIAAEFILELEPLNNGCDIWHFNGRGEYLDVDARQKLGLSYEGMAKAAELNDEDRLTFNEIAVELERNPQDYFTGFVETEDADFDPTKERHKS